MRKSFYTWLMAQRNPKSNEPVAILADLAFEDSTFPKHTDDFEEVKKKKVVFIAGGVGTAPVYPQVKWLHEHGIECDIIVGSQKRL